MQETKTPNVYEYPVGGSPIATLTGRLICRSARSRRE